MLPSGLNARLLSVAALVVVAALLVLGALSLAVRDLRDSTSDRARTAQISAAVARVQKSVLDLETGARAYALTRDAQFLEPWRRARARYAAEADKVVELLEDPEHEEYERRLARRLRSLEHSYVVDYSEPLVAAVPRWRPSNGSKATIAAVVDGKRRVDELREIAKDLLEHEDEHFTRSDASATRSTDRALTIAVVGSLFLIVLAGLGVWYIARPFRAMTLTVSEQHARLERQNASLERRVRDRTEDLEKSRYDALLMLAIAAEYRDDDTHQHTQRVGQNAGLVATALGLSEEAVELLRAAAPLHDIGKIGIPDGIMLKPGRLTAEEFAAMQEHVRIGPSILSSSDAQLFHIAAEIAATHHERWDGSGYPNGLTGEAIPLAGRIVAVVDVFDALTHERPYKEAWPIDRALAEIRAGSGTHFDPAVVEAFESISPQVLVGEREEEPALA